MASMIMTLNFRDSEDELALCVIDGILGRGGRKARPD